MKVMSLDQIIFKNIVMVSPMCYLQGEPELPCFLKGICGCSDLESWKASEQKNVNEEKNRGMTGKTRSHEHSSDVIENMMVVSCNHFPARQTHAPLPPSAAKRGPANCGF